MPSLPRVFVLLSVVFSVSATVETASAKRFNILVNAEADDEYTERTKDLEYQTYHFVQGQFFGGGTRDKGLETAEFQDLAESLSVVLKKRKFYPEPDKSKGDLMIMISWGRTALDPNYEDLMGIQSAGETMSAEDQDAQNQAPTSSSPDTRGASNGQAIGAMTNPNFGANQYLGGNFATSKGKNIMLLGLEDDLEVEFESTMARDSLWDVLDEERYFVILNAFDYQHLINEKKLKLVWRVRYNTKAIGIGFKNAFDSMNLAVSGVIGMQLDKVTTVKGDTKGSVKFGELEVIEMDELEKKEAAKKSE